MNKKVLLITVILIFLIFASYNISMYLVSKNYMESNNINEQLEDVMSRLDPNSQEFKDLAMINSEIKFINKYCMDTREIR